MEKNNLKDYNTARDIIKNAIGEAIRKKGVQLYGKEITHINIEDKEEIKMATEMIIVSPLLYETDEKHPKISEGMKKEIESVMRLFNQLFDEAYSEYMRTNKKNHQSKKVEIEDDKGKSTQKLNIQQKADIFNSRSKEFRKGIQQENYSNTKINTTEELEYTDVQVRKKTLKFNSQSHRRMGIEQEIEWDK